MSATKSKHEMSEEKVHEIAHKVLVTFLERRGWTLLSPMGWGESDCTAIDPATGEIVLLRLESDYVEHDTGDIPSIDYDEVVVERAKSLMHAYVAEHPDATSVRVDLVSIWLFTEETGRIAHLISACRWNDRT